MQVDEKVGCPPTSPRHKALFFSLLAPRTYHISQNKAIAKLKSTAGSTFQLSRRCDFLTK